MSKLFAGIDLGTSGCRLIIIDSDDCVQSSTSISYEATAVQTPDLWWQSVSKLIKDLPAEIRQNIQSLAIDGTSGSILLTDKSGNPSSSVLMYYDMRATKEAQQIRQTLSQNSGGQGASTSLARLLWLLTHEANPKHAHALHQADFILGKFANNYRISDVNNCLKLGYDVQNNCWPKALFEELGINPVLLPRVHPAGSAVAVIDSIISDKLGLPKTVKLVTGTTDSIAAFIATGATEIGEAVTSLGSTLVIKLISEKPIFKPKLGIYSHRLFDKGKVKWLVGGASNSGGKVLKHFFTQEQLDSMTPELKPDLHMALDYYPLVEAGERFPVADANKQPRLIPRPESDIDFFQGILESIAKIEKQGYESLEKLGAASLVSVRSVGGGCHNPAWTQIREQYLGVKMISPEHTEAAYGSALLALRAIKKQQSTGS